MCGPPGGTTVQPGRHGVAVTGLQGGEALSPSEERAIRPYAAGTRRWW